MLNTESIHWLRAYSPTLMSTIYLLSIGASRLIKNEMAIAAVRTYSAFSLLNTVYADNTINLQSGLVAYYPFNGNANDASGNQLHGFSYGATLTTDRFEKENSAYSFDGLSSYIKIGDPVPPLLQIQNSISLSSWIYVTSNPRGNGQLGFIVGCQYDVTTSGATIQFDGRINSDGQPSPSRHLHFQIGDGNWHVTNSNSEIPLQQWIHVVATRRANDVAKIYYNGILQPLNSVIWPGKIIYDRAMYAIGMQKDLGRYFNGKIDDVRIYNRSLSENEVLALYNHTPEITSALVKKDNTSSSQTAAITAATSVVAVAAIASCLYYYKKYDKFKKMIDNRDTSTFRDLISTELNGDENLRGENDIGMQSQPSVTYKKISLSPH